MLVTHNLLVSPDYSLEDVCSHLVSLSALAKQLLAQICPTQACFCCRGLPISSVRSNAQRPNSWRSSCPSRKFWWVSNQKFVDALQTQSPIYLMSSRLIVRRRFCGLNQHTRQGPTGPDGRENHWASSSSSSGESCACSSGRCAGGCKGGPQDLRFVITETRCMSAKLLSIEFLMTSMFFYRFGWF